MAKYGVVDPASFTPAEGGWSPVGDIVSWQQEGAEVALQAAGRSGPVLTFLSPTVFRLQWAADAGTPLSDYSYAVVDRNLGSVSPTVSDSGQALTIDTGTIEVVVDTAPYGLTVLRGGDVISRDLPGYNLVGTSDGATANLKAYPAGARYFALGEEAGATLDKGDHSLQFFNYDNFRYGGTPLDPSTPLYNSVPFLLEVNPAPASGSPYCYGLFLDNPGQSFVNLGYSTDGSMYGKIYVGALYGVMDQYFISGVDPTDVLSQYTALTGRPPMPPRYVFGFHQGGYGYFSRDVLEGVANGYRAADLPIDGLHIDVDFQDNYRTFTSSNMKFPDAKGMFDSLHTAGFKCSTNVTALITKNPLDENGSATTPYPARDSGLLANAFLYDARDTDDVSNVSGGPFFIGNESYGTDFGTNPFPYPPLQPDQYGNTPLGSYGYYPDFTRPDVRTWWGEQYEYLIGLGLDMVWQDMTCPALEQEPGYTPDKTLPLSLYHYDFGRFRPNAMLHNAYGLLLSQSTYEGLAKLRPSTRNFIIARGGFAGIQRYAGLWTGDSGSSWDFLAINVPEVLNLGLSGIPISGSDIGGFANDSGCVPYGDGRPGDGSQPPLVQNGAVQGGYTSPELLTRWMNAGAFLPWYRNHYDGYTKEFQEPYRYEEPVPTQCRTYMQLRYRLLHVFYTAMYQATQSGIPIARALFLEDAADPAVFDHLDDQFLLGADLLVAPVLQQGATSRSVYLPTTSQWYAFTNLVVPGAAERGLPLAYMAPLGPPLSGGIDEADAPVGTVPLYVRAGAIVPMLPAQSYVDEQPDAPTILDVYPGPDATATLYQDDGLTTAATTDAAYRISTVSTSWSAADLELTVERAHDGYTPPAPAFYVCVQGQDSPATVSVAGVSAPEAPDQATLVTNPGPGWLYDPDLRVVLVKVPDDAPSITVQVTSAG